LIIYIYILIIIRYKAILNFEFGQLFYIM
jgi:hypothetical protein